MLDRPRTYEADSCSIGVSGLAPSRSCAVIGSSFHGRQQVNTCSPHLSHCDSLFFLLASASRDLSWPPAGSSRPHPLLVSDARPGGHSPPVRRPRRAGGPGRGCPRRRCLGAPLSQALLPRATAAPSRPEQRRATRPREGAYSLSLSDPATAVSRVSGGRAGDWREPAAAAWENGEDYCRPAGLHQPVH